MKFSELIASFDEWASIKRKPKTRYYYHFYAKAFMLHAGDRELHQYRPIDLELWGSTWHKIQAIQRVMQFAVDSLEVTPRNPFRAVKRPPAGFRKRVLPPRQITSLIRHAKAQFRRYLVALRETLGRPQELRAVRLVDIKSVEPSADVATSLLTGRSYFDVEGFKCFDRRSDLAPTRILPISPRLGRLIVRIITQDGVAGDEPIFRNCEGKPWTGNACRCQMRRLRRRAKLTRDGRGENVVNYTLRHSMATELVRRGVRDKALAELLGHTTTKTTQRYIHLSPGDLIDIFQQAFERTPPGP